MIKDTVSNLYDDFNTLVNEIKDNEELLSILKPYLKMVVQFEEEGRLLKIKFTPFTFIHVQVDGLNTSKKSFDLLKRWLEDDK